MSHCRPQRTNADAVLFRQRALPASAAEAVTALRRHGAAWVWLLAFLLVAQAHATHLHLPTSASHDAASVHAPVPLAEAGTSAAGSGCTVCTTLATAHGTLNCATAAD